MLGGWGPGAGAGLGSADLGSLEPVARIVSEAVEAFGGIDILVNNAGVALGGRFLQTSEEDFDWLMDACRTRGLTVMLDGAFNHVAATHPAVAEGLAGSTAGGSHHARREQGAGFCVFNDVAVAARALRHEGAITRALVVDLDVHQGDGTASLCADDPLTYTLSVHGAANYPFHRETSSLDVDAAERGGCAAG